MKEALLTAKHCRKRAWFFKKVIPIDLDSDNYLDYGVPFRIGFVSGGQKSEFLVPNIRTRNYTHYIVAYRKLDYEIGDRVVFDRLIWTIEDVNFTYDDEGIKRYFITLK